MPTSVPEDYLGQWRYLRRGVQTSSHIVLENGVLLEVDKEGAVEANSKTAMQHAFHEDIRNSMAVCG